MFFNKQFVHKHNSLKNLVMFYKIITHYSKPKKFYKLYLGWSKYTYMFFMDQKILLIYTSLDSFPGSIEIHNWFTGNYSFINYKDIKLLYKDSHIFFKKNLILSYVDNTYDYYHDTYQHTLKFKPKKRIVWNSSKYYYQDGSHNYKNVDLALRKEFKKINRK